MKPPIKNNLLTLARRLLGLATAAPAVQPPPPVVVPAVGRITQLEPARRHRTLVRIGSDGHFTAFALVDRTAPAGPGFIWLRVDVWHN